VFRNGLQILANGSRRGQSSLSVARCWSLIPLARFSAWTPAIRSSWTRSADVSVASASKTAWLGNEQLQLYVLSSMECSDKRRQRSSCIVLAVFVALAWSAQDAAACFCPAGGACGDVTKADSVFVATVERIEPNVLNNGSAFAGRAVHLTDIRSLRGETPSSVMTGLGGGDCGCADAARSCHCRCSDAVGTTGPFDSAQGVQTDRAGHYRMTLYRDTSYRILVRRAQKTLSTVDITGGETSLVITLAK
jgi:hypothetical protein